jgi:hypothetical protein
LRQRSSAQRIPGDHTAGAKAFDEWLELVLVVSP